MLNYAFLTAAVILFGLQFRFNQTYEREQGGGLAAAIRFIFYHSLFGLAVLVVIDLALASGIPGGVRAGDLPFPLLMAAMCTLDAIGYSYCSIMALGKVNLSLYAVFAMIGGMALPFAVGLFFGEPLTTGKILCLVIVTAAVLVTLNPKEKTRGLGWCLGVFVFNGMSGVIAKIYSAVQLPKVSDELYSVLCAAVTAAVAGVWLLFIKGEKKRMTKKAVLSCLGFGTFNRVANLLVLISLSSIPATAQYPFITGGVIIVSTVIALLTKQKPTKTEWVSMALSIAGLTVLLIVR